MTQEIAWGDGSGDKIYLTYSASTGDQTVLVSSDANTGYTTRSKNIIFSASGASSVTLTVSQTGKDITIITRNDVAITVNDVAVGYE